MMIIEKMEVVWPTLALIVAIIALGAALYSEAPAAVGIALATILVATASVYLYISRPRRTLSRTPVEDFSWWADVGEPLASLKKMDPKSIAVPSVFLSDMRSIARNVELLFQRLRLVVWRSDFSDMPSRDVITELDTVRSFLQMMLRKVEREMRLEPNFHESIADLASRMKKIAGTLSGYLQTKPEVLRAYVNPLARAAERIAGDLETASENYREFARIAFGAG